MYVFCISNKVEMKNILKIKNKVQTIQILLV